MAGFEDIIAEREKNSEFEHGYTTEITKRTVAAYLDVVKDKSPDQAEKLEELMRISLIDDENTRAEEHKKFNKTWENEVADSIEKSNTALTEPEKELLAKEKLETEKLELFERLTKVGDLGRVTRKVAAGYILHEHAKEGEHTADRYEATLGLLSDPEKMGEKGPVSSEDMQKLVDENASIHFSLTAHPTNPTTVEFSKAALEIEKILARQDGKADELKVAMKTLDEAPLLGDKKTVALEVEEFLIIADQIYDAVPDVHRSLRRNLDKFGYEDVEVPDVIAHMSTWVAGDGDGNPNVTRDVLIEAKEQLREHITDRYIKDIDKIHSDLIEIGADNDAISQLRETIDTLIENKSNGELIDSEKLLENLKEIRESFEEAGMNPSNIEGMINRVNTFGSYAAKIDIRHNADDIMVTVAKVFEETGQFGDDKLFKNAEDFLKTHNTSNEDHNFHEAAQLKMISEKFNDKEFLERAGTLSSSQLIKDENNEQEATADRVFGRLREAAIVPEGKDNQEISEKLIIAEATNATHGLGALLLLKASGHEVANDKAKMDIVPLFESRKELEDSAKIVEKMMENEIFNEHVKNKGQLKIMLAKSDTQRQSGSAVKGAQEQAIADLHALNNKYDVPVSVFHGGGMSLQRGGGKSTELSTITADALMQRDIGKMAPPDTTIQGHQGRLLLGSKASAQNYLSHSVSQQIFNSARVEGHVDGGKSTSRTESRESRANAKEFFDAGVKSYEDEWFKNKSIIDLAREKFPWVQTKESNVSSRANMRGQKEAEGDLTPSKIMGYKDGDDANNAKVSDPFGQRAITFDRLMAHSGTYASSFLGVKEAFDKVKTGDADKDAKKLHETFEGSKSFRDLMRNQAMILEMTNLDHAWDLAGRDERPSNKEIDELASQYKKGKDETNSSEVTLAYLEKYTKDIAKNVYMAVNGVDPDKEIGADNFKTADALKSTWPELQAQMDLRKRLAEPLFEESAKITRELKANPDKVIAEKDLLMARVAYAGEEIALNTPSGVGLTQTDKKKDQKTNLSEKDVEDKLRIPSALYNGKDRSMGK